MFVKCEEEKHGKILKWMSKMKYKEHHENALDGIVEGTGYWLFRKKEYREWQSSAVSSILWLHGIRMYHAT